MASTRSRGLAAGVLLALAVSLASSPAAAQTPLGTPCTGLSWDTNVETSLVAMTGPGTNLILQRFETVTPALRVTSVCVAGRAAAGGTGAYEVVLYYDAGGVPGARLAAVASPSPAVSPAPTWMTTDVTERGVVVSGPFWAGIREVGWQVTLSAGVPNPATAVATSSNDGASFGFSAGSSLTLLVRVSGQEVGGVGVVPALPGSGLAALALALAIGGAALLKRA